MATLWQRAVAGKHQAHEDEAPEAVALACCQRARRFSGSQVYGDFSRGFPPTLIQGGLKKTLLSGFVRLYQALDIALDSQVFEALTFLRQRLDRRDDLVRHLIVLCVGCRILGGGRNPAPREV
jgi:hypothetical protein